MHFRYLRSMACKTIIICICQLGCKPSSQTNTSLFLVFKRSWLWGQPKFRGWLWPKFRKVKISWSLVTRMRMVWSWSRIGFDQIEKQGWEVNRGYNNKFQEKQKRWWDVFSKHAQTEKWQGKRGRLLSWIGPINWGQKIRVLEKGGEKGRKY